MRQRGDINVLFMDKIFEHIRKNRRATLTELCEKFGVSPATMRNDLDEIQKQGTAILMITSSVSDTMDISDRLLVVEQGKVAASYDRSEFKRIVR